MFSGAVLSRSRGLVGGRRRLHTVGIVANEFFDPALGRMGGFGWAARRTAECLQERPELGYAPVFLAGRGGIADHKRARRSNGTRLVRFDEDDKRYARVLARERVSLFLAIDLRPNYARVLEARPETPAVVWVRDPRTPDDVQRISTLEIPGSDVPPLGIAPVENGSLARSGLVFASPAPALATRKASAAYGTSVGEVGLLPNPLDVVPEDGAENPNPLVVFLSRLDPIKRPWVFVELARRFPSVEFVMLGQSHFTGAGSWQPSRLPANLRLLGHVDEATKTPLLRSAWMLVNTSIQESLAISFLEALHCATPVVACHDPEQVTSRFGAFVGQWDGSGLDGLDAYSEAVERLLEDHDLRARLGDEGRSWVRSTHTREHFLAAFARLAGAAVRDAG